jgi:hypothetical protein
VLPAAELFILGGKEERHEPPCRWQHTRRRQLRVVGGVSGRDGEREKAEKKSDEDDCYMEDRNTTRRYMSNRLGVRREIAK